MRRRDFMRLSSLSALQLYVMECTASRPKRKDSEPSSRSSERTRELGPLIEAKDGLLDLPEGFSYVIVQRALDSMSDGYTVPYQPDGMS